MTIKELKNKLNEYDENLEVYVYFDGWCESEEVTLYGDDLNLHLDKNKYDADELCIMNDMAYKNLEEEYDV